MSGVPGVGVQDKGLQRIRARSSYRLFRELYEFLKNEPDGMAVLRKFYEVLDTRGGSAAGPTPATPPRAWARS